MDSVYINDDRVVPHPDGTFMVFHGNTEYNVAPMRDLGTLQVIPGRFALFDADGKFLGNIGRFDDVVHSAIGDPR